MPLRARLPLFELTLLLVVMIIGLAEVNIYKISHNVEEAQKKATGQLDQLKQDLAQGRQQADREKRDLRAKLNVVMEDAVNSKRQSEQLQKILTELSSDFTNLLPTLQKAQTRDNVVVQEATRIRDEYSDLAERMEGSANALQSTLTNFIARKGPAEAEAFDHYNQELKIWLAKQKERMEAERLPGKSRNLHETLRREQFGMSNVTASTSKDLGRLLTDFSRVYTNYVTNALYVLRNQGKPITGNVTAEINKARQQHAQLLKVAGQARSEAKLIENYLEPQGEDRQASRERAIQTIVRAQAQLDATHVAHAQRQSNSLLAATGIESDQTNVEPEPKAVSNATEAAAPSFGFVSALYPLMLAQVGLAVFLMVAIYRRVVVEGLRFRLYESATETKLAHVGQLAAWLAHEIRQPLTAINAWLWTLQKTVTEGMPEHMGATAMRKEINRLDQIVKDFLRFTQPAMPKMVPVQAESVLQEIQTLLAPQLQQQNIRLELGPVADARFYADPQQLKQVIMNLVTNAAESIEQETTMESGRITLRARRDKGQLKGEPSDVIVIEVEDTGPGIAPEVQQRLFDPFFSTKEEGTGLGLPIAAKILETHGGELKFKTELGTGTTFRVVLPAVRKGS